MARIVLVTGGARSGKSDYAQNRAEQLAEPRYFIATCPKVDSEMEERIEKHRAARKNKNWQTIEEPLKLEEIFRLKLDNGTIVVDCITLWVSNLMEAFYKEGIQCTEEKITDIIENLLIRVQCVEGTVFFVTNEVGLGIVPENAVARRYRDLVGRCNRLIAHHADEVVLISCGLPLILKNTI